MKKNLYLIVTALACMIAGSAYAQTPKPRAPHAALPAAPTITANAVTIQVHQNGLTWQASPDAVAGSTFSNVYRASGACPASNAVTSFSKINTSNTISPSGPFTDTINLVAGQSNSYVVTNVIGGVESSASNCITLTTPTFSPTGLSGTSQ